MDKSKTNNTLVFIKYMPHEEMNVLILKNFLLLRKYTNSELIYTRQNTTRLLV